MDVSRKIEIKIVSRMAEPSLLGREYVNDCSRLELKLS